VYEESEGVMKLCCKWCSAFKICCLKSEETSSYNDMENEERVVGSEGHVGQLSSPLYDGVGEASNFDSKSLTTTTTITRNLSQTRVSRNSTTSHKSSKKVLATVMRYHLFRHVIFMVLFLLIFVVTLLDSINQKISVVGVSKIV
jgi:hypothetical protein